MVLYSPTPPAVVHQEVTGPVRAEITRIRARRGTEARRGIIRLLLERVLRAECCSKIASDKIK